MIAFATSVLPWTSEAMSPGAMSAPRQSSSRPCSAPSAGSSGVVGTL